MKIAVILKQPWCVGWLTYESWDLLNFVVNCAKEAKQIELVFGIGTTTLDHTYIISEWDLGLPK